MLANGSVCVREQKFWWESFGKCSSDNRLLGRGLDLDIGWIRGLGAWLVGLDIGAETLIVGDVLDDTCSRIKSFID